MVSGNPRRFIRLIRVPAALPPRRRARTLSIRPLAASLVSALQPATPPKDKPLSKANMGTGCENVWYAGQSDNGRLWLLAGRNLWARCSESLDAILALMTLFARNAEFLESARFASRHCVFRVYLKSGFSLGLTRRV